MAATIRLPWPLILVARSLASESGQSCDYAALPRLPGLPQYRNNAIITHLFLYLGAVIMAYISPQIIPSDWNPSFSGHETFVLRGSWLKKAYDLILNTPSLFSHENAFVMLGVGKNMAQSIRHWGKVCTIFERCADGSGFQPTQLGHALFADDGWDPFLVTPTSAWLLHWQIAARPEGASTWFYTFNLFRSGEWTVEQLCDHLDTWCAEHDWRRPSGTTVRRDVECMLQSYSRPTRKQAGAAEDGLLCPLSDLDLVHSIGNSYRLSSSAQSTLPDELVAFAIHEWLRRYGRRTVSFGELAYSPCSPGRVFRLDEDALLQRLQRIEQTTAGAAYFTDQAGIRQVASIPSPISHSSRQRRERRVTVIAMARRN